MNEVKLIIWDLDNTLWKGTLAEQEEIVLNQALVEKIQFLIKRGIMHSICSKNKHSKAEEMLKKFGIYDLFIFPMISFEDKGVSVKKIIKKAQLREQNVLVVDDNDFVLREITFHNPNIMTQLIDKFLLEDISKWGKNDNQCTRLAQYKILEKKEKDKAVFLEKINDEKAFLKDCIIEIELIPLKADDNDIERIIDLVNRSNQMNYTKSRIKYEYLFILFELKNGINFKVHVKDKYGDYGIVGYICIIDNTLIHYAFSCRLLGMCVESRLYQWLQTNYPKIKHSFNRSILKQINTNLDFITVTVETQIRTKKPLHLDKKILIRGPCITNAISFNLNELYHVDEEVFYFFEYANLHFLRKYISNEKEERFEKTLNAIRNNSYSTIVNFLESDYYSGLYKIRNQLTPITSNYIFWKSVHEMKKDNKLLGDFFETLILDGMNNINTFNIGNRFSPWPLLEKFTYTALNWFGLVGKKFIHKLVMYFVFKNYQGYVSISQFKQDISWYIDQFPESTQLIFINPPENIRLPLINETQNQIIVERTQILNGIMRSIAQRKSNVYLLEMDNLLKQEDILNNFSHLKRQGYVKLSNALLKAVNEWTKYIEKRTRNKSKIINETKSDVQTHHQQ